MPYLVDGHNLIPKIPSLSLEHLDDEIQLVEMLQVFCHRRQKKIEVYFDKAPPGQPKARSFGLVTAHFVREQIPADLAIHRRLGLLGKQARNWTVVSSDHSVQLFARAARAKVLTSEQFADQIMEAMQETTSKPTTDELSPLSNSEIAEWLKLFRNRPPEK